MCTFLWVDVYSYMCFFFFPLRNAFSSWCGYIFRRQRAIAARQFCKCSPVDLW